MKLFENVMEKVSDKKPEIFVALGIGFGIAGVVSACVATLHVEEIVDEHKKSIDAVKEDYISTEVLENGTTIIENRDEKAYRKDITKVYLNTVVQTGRQYALSGALFGLSAACIIGEYKIIKELKVENVGLAAGWKATESILARYRQQMREEKGEEEEQRFYAGTETRDIEITTVDDKGKEKKTKVKGAEVLNGEVGKYAFIFDKSCGAFVGENTNIDHNLYVANLLQTSATNDLYNHKCLMFNEILDAFGKARVPEGWKLGILSTEKGGYSDQVDFQIRIVYIWDDETNEYVERILIDPKLDGMIADRI